MRRFAKRSLEFMTVQTGLAGAWRALRPQRAIILAYHNIVPAGEPTRGDSSLHLPLDEFVRQLDLLDQCFRVTPLHELLSNGSEGRRPLAAITFDDAYRGALQLAVPEIVKRGLSATVFVSPGLLGSNGFWWDLISDDRTGSIPGRVRERALWGLAGKQASVLHEIRIGDPVPRSLPPICGPATEEEVRDLCQHPGVFLGSHTWSHVNLAAVSENEAVMEMKKSFDWLKERPSFRPVISYPYGLWKAELEPLARAAGYGFGLLIQGGRAVLPISEGEAFCVPRLNIPRGLSSDGFIARMSGVWPR